MKPINQQLDEEIFENCLISNTHLLLRFRPHLHPSYNHIIRIRLFFYIHLPFPLNTLRRRRHFIEDRLYIGLNYGTSVLELK